MQRKTLIERRISELRKRISILEWDIPNIRNNELRSMKEKELMFCRGELQPLLEEARKLVC